MSKRWGLRLAAVTTACLWGAIGVHAQTAPPAPVPATPADDMTMPDDLGAPMASAPPPALVAQGRPLSVNSPIAAIAATPQGKAVLERQLPGLCERPEYVVFKTMTLTQLAGMSHGRITEAKLDAVQADLSRAGPLVAPPPSHNLFDPITRTATDSVRYGGRQIKSISHSIYHRVALVIASL